VRLAHALRESRGLPAEIISADAFLVYRGMDIGTAKPTLAERGGVPHHLIDIRDPREPFTVDTWLGLANQAIADCHARGVTPIVVGGTHLYVKALLDGLFEGPKPDPELRAALAAMDPIERRAELERADPAAAARIHPSDVRRTVRALEVFRQTGTPISQLQTQWDVDAKRSDDRRFLLVILDWETSAINQRINARVKRMFESGLVDEVRGWLESDAARWDDGIRLPQSAHALGYKQVLEMLYVALARGGEPMPSEVEACIERVKIETRRLAKNQRTWLRRLRAHPGPPVPLVLEMPTEPSSAVDQIVKRMFGS
jgi:tRNA dimethylallyltransferase